VEVGEVVVMVLAVMVSFVADCGGVEGQSSEL
jgi:hypothetical protein